MGNTFSHKLLTVFISMACAASALLPSYIVIYQTIEKNRHAKYIIPVFFVLFFLSSIFTDEKNKMKIIAQWSISGYCLSSSSYVFVVIYFEPDVFFNIFRYVDFINISILILFLWPIMSLSWLFGGIAAIFFFLLRDYLKKA